MTVRLSLGGAVVESSLAAAGYGDFPRSTRLVETRPRFRAPRVVLVQSAWNVIPRQEFSSHIRGYPRAMQVKAQLRRVVAHSELRRTDKVVVLTQAMRSLLEDSYPDAEVAPVTLPADLLHAPSTPVERRRPFVLVPGTVTDYKRPFRAFSMAEQALGSRTPTTFVFCGPVDGSSAKATVVQEAKRFNAEVDFRRASRLEMFHLLRGAEVTVLPSSLESLGFSFSEALLLSEMVVGSAIPAHLELAKRLGTLRTTQTDGDVLLSHGPPPVLSPAVIERFMSEWRDLGDVLMERPDA